MPKSPQKRVGGKRGPKPRPMPLKKIEALAKLGFRDLSKIGRRLGIPRETLAHGALADQVRAAFERGRLAAEELALRQYEQAIHKKASNTGLVIFKMKQFGWTDKLQSIDTPADVTEGAIERLRQLVSLKREQIEEQRAAGGKA